MNAIVFLLAFTASCSAPATSELEGCVGPLDCKFDRVCVANMCMEPQDAGDESSGAPASGDSDATESSAADTSPPAESSSSDGTTEPTCGWGPTGQDEVQEGYVCGGAGSDPNEAFDADCPAAITLTVGDECGPISGIGCCDAAGDVWYCADDGSGPVLHTEDCTS